MSLPPIHPAESQGPVPDGASAAQRFLRAGTLQLGAPPPLSIYVHLPWCLKKCPYCDFNSHEWAPKTPAASPPQGGAFGLGRPGAEPLNALPEARYLDALRADLEASLPLVWCRSVHSIFIGGGTPSLFSPDAIARLLSDLRQLLPLQPGCEVTMEANPGTFEKDRFRAFHQAGVTRLSIGVQSFNDDKLKALGRVHDSAQALAAVEEAAATFGTFNLDLMYALPGQTQAELAADLRTALQFNPPHLSLYHLTLEPNTVFASRPPVLPDDDTSAAMLDQVTDTLAAAGMDRYEVSAYARPGHRCTHNLNYWQFGDYLGLGAGAHGKLSFPHRVVRQVKWREPAAYMREALAGRAVSNEEEVSRKALPFEFMLNLLRLRHGFEPALFTERTGLPPSAIAAGLQLAKAKGLLEQVQAETGPLLRPTARGFDFLSDLQSLFL
ncbi:radical SAM family heme chaperone HemW [Ideonella azotifigens]|uniref:Heme chaperone HemW n=1 Tax=Ideonella azotifigens TaxID=513160 RepID=A0ABN1JY98_9BURK|nr:radical SAM family heme chaperone HemW [Ideonella azotifigens]MCD2341448.1 radical SAM family heme chaperone HemW [Ideonella azotifigens]